MRQIHDSLGTIAWEERALRTYIRLYKTYNYIHQQITLTPHLTNTLAATIWLDKWFSWKGRMMPKSYTAEFQAFWDMYPRRVGKRTAFMAFEAAKKRATVSEIMRGAYEMQVQVDDGKEMQFVPHPSTWLNRDGWEDEYAVSQSPLSPSEIGVQKAIEAHNALIHRKRAEARTKVDAGLSGPDEELGRKAVRRTHDPAALLVDWTGRDPH